MAIDREAGIIVANGRFAHFTAQEFEIFQALFDAKGRIQTKENLLSVIAPIIDDEPGIKIVDIYVCKIRKKLTGLGLAIETVWGRGYRINQRGATV
ncbi:winged helix-turn-helix domain-containing protein [Rhizobium rhizogenes]|uniref:winged helix-turn-helix domain-containing protein n=1 Tax=Rhizobium rhizogenes TaxID=359 RepID=UPI0015732332|nr:winged helix-turn-helix domain-containing protein [Rhizobium rhizogenes]NTF67715.1 winged helix-turn-helix transcriptional regulator [Rhizobium rhizogenes]